MKGLVKTINVSGCGTRLLVSGLMSVITYSTGALLKWFSTRRYQDIYLFGAQKPQKLSYLTLQNYFARSNTRFCDYRPNNFIMIRLYTRSQRIDNLDFFSVIIAKRKF